MTPWTEMEIVDKITLIICFANGSYMATKNEAFFEIEKNLIEITEDILYGLKDEINVETNSESTQQDSEI